MTAASTLAHESSPSLTSVNTNSTQVSPKGVFRNPRMCVTEITGSFTPTEIKLKPRIIDIQMGD